METKLVLNEGEKILKESMVTYVKSNINSDVVDLIITNQRVAISQRNLTGFLLGGAIGSHILKSIFPSAFSKVTSINKSDIESVSENSIGVFKPLVEIVTKDGEKYNFHVKEVQEYMDLINQK